MTMRDIPPPVIRLLYSQRDAASALGVSLRTIEAYVAAGTLKTRRIGRRVMIPATEVQRFARADHASPS